MFQIIQQFVLCNLSFTDLCLDQINFIDNKMLDRGIGREILVVAHDTKLCSINFFGKKSRKHDTFFYIWIILLQITFFGNHLTKNDFKKNSRRCPYIYAYWLQL
jgi:hypothetical protein